MTCSLTVCMHVLLEAESYSCWGCIAPGEKPVFSDLEQCRHLSTCPFLALSPKSSLALLILPVQDGITDWAQPRHIQRVINGYFLSV